VASTADNDILMYILNYISVHRCSLKGRCTGHTQKNGADFVYSLLIPHHSFVYALYYVRQSVVNKAVRRASKG
jgi:hypothetical protein